MTIFFTKSPFILFRRSLACTYVEILTGSPPNIPPNFRAAASVTVIERMIINGRMEYKLPSFATAATEQFLKFMFVRDMNMRPSASNVINCRYLAGVSTA